MSFEEYWWQESSAQGGALRYRGTQYLEATLGAPTSTTTGTFSFWFKRGAPSQGTKTYQALFACSSTWRFTYEPGSGNFDDLILSGVTADGWSTRESYRDTTAWTHVLIVYDTGNAVAEDRIRFFKNGVRIPRRNGLTPGLNANRVFGTNEYHRIGAQIGGTGETFYGYIGEVAHVDGAALDPTSFGIFDGNGVWTPLDSSVIVNNIGLGVGFGNNGFYLDNKDATAIGTDVSGSGNNFLPINFDFTVDTSLTYDVVQDSPFVNAHTWQWLYNTNQSNSDQMGIGLHSLTQLRFSQGGNLSRNTFSTGSFSIGGQYYWECQQGPTWGGQAGCATVMGFGIMKSNTFISTSNREWVGYGVWWPGTGNGFGAALSADIIFNNVTTTVPLTNDWRPGRVAGMEVDTLSNTGNIRFYVDGVLVGTGDFNFGAITDESKKLFQLYTEIGSQPNQFCYLNAGQFPFVYDSPSGYLAPHAVNNGAVPVANPAPGFNVALDTGANILATTQGLVGNGLWWVKDRVNNDDNLLVDHLRGAGQAFECPGPGNLGGTSVAYTAPTGNSVGYGWADDPAYGFDIVRYVGNNADNRFIAYDLGKPAEFIILKDEDTVHSFRVWHKDLNSIDWFLNLNNQDAQTQANPSGQIFGGTSLTAPTAGGFTIGNFNAVNQTGDNFTAYCWTSIPGFSTFGTYMGNGQVDGPLVYCGFTPAFVMIKIRDDAGSNWHINDITRKTYNPQNLWMLANTVGPEVNATQTTIDIIANGFKVRAPGNPEVNQAARRYVFAAFAKHPFAGNNVAPATAR